MKFIKLAILSFVFLFLLLTAFSLFIPSQVQLSKALKMNTQPDSLWHVVDDFRTWGLWNTLFPGLSMETPEFTGTGMKTMDAEVEWESRQPELHVSLIKRGNRKPIRSGWKIVNDGLTGSINVQWYIEIKLRWYPWEKFAGMLYEKSYGDKLMEGLINLKSILENNPSPE